MLFGVPIFQCVNFAQLFHAAKFQPIVIPNTISPLAHNLLSSLLQRDPNLRISWDDFFQHSYFSSSDYSSPHSIPSLPSIPSPSSVPPPIIIEQKIRISNEVNNIGDDFDDLQIPDPVDSLHSLPSFSSTSFTEINQENNSLPSDHPFNHSKVTSCENDHNIGNNDQVKSNCTNDSRILDDFSIKGSEKMASISAVLDDFVFVQRYSEIEFCFSFLFI